MSNKYILSTSGKVLEVVTNNEGKESYSDNPDGLIQPNIVDADTVAIDLANEQTRKYRSTKSNTFLSANFGEQNADYSAVTLLDDNVGENLVVNKTHTSSSFNFVDDPNNEQEGESYKAMYNFTDETHFADEFEILTGFGFSQNDIETDEQVSLLFTYFVGIIAKFAVVEGIILLNKLLSEDVSQREKYNLILGEYTVTEYDVFTRYIYKVLNYPHDNRSLDGFLERTTAYFIGFSEWLSPDGLLDLNELVKNSKVKNMLDGTGFIKTDGVLSYLLAITSGVIEVTLASLTNPAQNKRAKLLLKKFYQEQYWKKNVLYTAKKEFPAEGFFSDMNFYFFKFAIERMHVGLKLLHKYIYDDSYLKLDVIDGPLNRVSAARSKDKNTIDYSSDDVIKYTTSYQSEGPLVVKWKSNLSDNSFPALNKKPGQTTRIRALPQLLNLHEDFIKNLANNSGGDTPLLLLGDDLKQNFVESNSKRLSQELVKQYENNLEAEYMPFYFHDLRTNEILSFHAFIENISDAFNPDYAEQTGFGRIDSVRAYRKTTRNINMTFSLAATSESDHDLMWYQINKLVAMVYPQWSDGYDSTNTKMKYPFTQVPTSSPLIRLRIGDIVKSNYSRSSLSRLHGLKGSAANEKISKYDLLPGLYKTKPSFLSPSEYVKVDTTIEVFDWDVSFSKKDSEGTVVLSKEESPIDEEVTLIVDANKIVPKTADVISTGTPGADAIMKPFNGGAINNPITASYESGMSRGLAGFITQLDLNYSESTWETGRIGSKAPIFVKINVNFAPIHDIPPGLDHNGMLRAPVYNVGRINNEMFGDPQDGAMLNSGREAAMTKYMRIAKGSTKS